MKLPNYGQAQKALGLTFGLAGCVLLPHGAQAALKQKSVLAGQLDMALGLEAMTGETNYAIGGQYAFANGQAGSARFPLSRLEWPLDTWLARLDAGWTFNPAVRLNGAVKTNLSDPDGNMKDWDWGSTSNQLDLYSESRIASFDAFILDINLEWTFWQKGLWTFYTGAGYQHQNFQHEAAPLYQYSPSRRQADLEQTWNGHEIGVAYEMTYSLPYLLIGSECQLTPELRLAGSFALSPLAGAEDQDNHLFTDKVSVGDMDGHALMLELSGIYYVTPWWFMEAGARHVSIETDGDQNQTVAGRPLGKISIEAESQQTSGYLNVGYSF